MNIKIKWNNFLFL